jgi:DNA-binding response OmpR family regulator
MGKLFIVNDDLSILRVLKMRLESEGYQVDVDSEIKAARIWP